MGWHAPWTAAEWKSGAKDIPAASARQRFIEAADRGARGERRRAGRLPAGDGSRAHIDRPRLGSKARAVVRLFEAKRLPTQSALRGGARAAFVGEEAAEHPCRLLVNL